MKTVLIVFEIEIVSDVSKEDAASMALAKLWLSADKPKPITIRVMEKEQAE